MLDIPMFTTEYGVGSLTLSQIPYNQTAYIRIHDASEPDVFLKECADFCKAVGADKVYATGHACLESQPFYCTVLQMNCAVSILNDTDCCLFPLREETADLWRNVYNERMAGIPIAAYLTKRDVQKIIDKGSGYFVHKDGKMLGIGVASGDTIDAVISTVRGAGHIVLCALASVLTEDVAKVEVASTNIPAVSLYERAGFVKMQEVASWYKIF